MRLLCILTAPNDEVEETFIPNDPLNEPFYGTEESEDKLYEDR